MNPKLLKNSFDNLSDDQYYVRRKLETVNGSYEEDYWGKSIDPDGNVRFMCEEKDQKKSWAAAELEFINRLGGGKLLDVGCGAGAVLDGVDNKWEKYGVEVSKFASEIANEYGVIFNGDLLSACYDSNSFDLVLVFHVIEHLPNPLQTLCEIRRILKPGGWLIIGTPDFDSGCARRFGDNFRLLHDQTHVSLFSNDSLQRMLNDYGFRVEHTEFEFFDTQYFTIENLSRLFDVDNVSPPFYGNIVTKYCKKLTSAQIDEKLARLSSLYKKLLNKP